MSEIVRPIFLLARRTKDATNGFSLEVLFPLVFLVSGIGIFVFLTCRAVDRDPSSMKWYEAYYATKAVEVLHYVVAYDI